MHIYNHTFFYSYAEQQRHDNPPPPFAAKWEPVDVSIMKAWVGLCMLMGILRLPSRHGYWRKSKLLLRTQFGTVMSRNRFDQIWHYLHLSDNAGDDGSDKLYKLRWFMNFLNDKFMTVYVPDGHFTLDESMIKFKGRLQFRHYMPAKPIKWGVKVWTLAESTTGYMSRFQVYIGRDGNDQEHGLSHRVVMDLSTHL